MPEPAQFSTSKRRLLEKYLQEGSSRSRSPDQIHRRPTGFPVPLSLSQEQVVLEDEALKNKTSVFSESFTMHRTGSLDIPVLERCLAEIVRRHEIWRTSFEMKDGRIFQRIQSFNGPYHLPFVDVRSFADREVAAVRLASEQACEPFDLRNGPLVRSLLAQLDDSKFRLYMTAHQSVVDGISVFRIFPTELTVLYESFAAGRPSSLPELPIQFGDYACWQRNQPIDNQIAYWEKQLEGVSRPLDWPGGSVLTSESTHRGEIHAFTWPASLTDTLRKLSQQRGITLFSTLLAGFSMLFHLYTGQDDIILGTLSPSGRKRAEVQTLLGYFLNPVALRMYVKSDARFHDLLLEARDVVSGALTNDDIPLEQIAARLHPKSIVRGNPFFQVAISLAPDVAPLPEGWTQSYMDVGSGGSRWPLYIEFSDRPTGLIGRAQYNPDVIDLLLLERTLKDLEVLLTEVCAQPDRRVSELSFSAIA